MSITVESKLLETDEEGFLMDPGGWNRLVAEHIATIEQLELTDERWAVVSFVRDYFEERHTVPEARVVLKALGQRIGKDQATRKYLQSLFPYGYGQQACKIAGMRKPRKLMLDV